MIEQRHPATETERSRHETHRHRHRTRSTLPTPTATWSSTPITRHLYATDGGIYQIEPLGVVCPRDAEDVSRLVAYCTERGVPLVPRGAGSGLAGAAIGAGLMVDFTRYMNKILEVAPDGSWARVQPGAGDGRAERRTSSSSAPSSPPTPPARTTARLGGMIANNSSGGRSVAYGATKDHVLALEVVLHGGEVFRAPALGRRSAELAAVLAGDGVGRASLRPDAAAAGGQAGGHRRLHAPRAEELLGLPGGDRAGRRARPTCTSSSSAPKARWA